MIRFVNKFLVGVDIGTRKKTITYRTLENAAGNHLFDDHPEFFDITEREGSIIRATFQESAFLKDNWKQNLIDWGIVDS